MPQKLLLLKEKWEEITEEEWLQTSHEETATLVEDAEGLPAGYFRRVN